MFDTLNAITKTYIDLHNDSHVVSVDDEFVEELLVDTIVIENFSSGSRETCLLVKESPLLPSHEVSISSPKI